MGEKRYLIWDFDRTLAERRGGRWGSALAEVLQRRRPERVVSADAFVPDLRNGFPWHRWEEVRDPPGDDASWWREMEPLFARAFRKAARLADKEAEACAREVREVYLDPEAWLVYPDATPALERLSEDGWRHFILSNHVPELEGLVGRIGLRQWFLEVHSSARTGVEKPHPEAFLRIVRKLDPGSRIEVVGDSIVSDIEGARRAGLQGVLVRRDRPGEGRCCRSLEDLPALLGVPPDEA